MNITSVRLDQHGFSGGEIEYYEEQEKNGHKKLQQVIKRPKHPVHLSLEKAFKDLRIHLLEANGYIHEGMEKKYIDQLILETTVTKMQFTGETIVLFGTKSVFDDKEISFKTCKMQESDDYENWEGLLAIVETIREEAIEYMAGTKKVDDTEVAIRYVEAGLAKGVTIDEIKALPPEKLKEWATKLLENSFGSVVLNSDDITHENVDVDESMEELDAIKEESVPESFVVDETEGVTIPVSELPKPEKVKKEKKKEKVVLAAQSSTEEPEF